jgi:hypothetical protein
MAPPVSAHPILVTMTPPWVFRATAVNCWVCAATRVTVSGAIVTVASSSGGGRGRRDRGGRAGRDHDLGRVLPPSGAGRGDDVGDPGVAGKDVADGVLGQHAEHPIGVPDGPGDPTRAAHGVVVLVEAGGGEQALVAVLERVEVGPEHQRVHPEPGVGGGGKGGPAGHQEDYADQERESLHPTPTRRKPRLPQERERRGRVPKVVRWPTPLTYMTRRYTARHPSPPRSTSPRRPGRTPARGSRGRRW